MNVVELHDKNNEILIPKVWLPIGTIYTNENDISDEIASRFYGVWEKYSKGRVLVGVDENDEDFLPNKTGGSKYLQEHNHIQTLGGFSSVDGNANGKTEAYGYIVSNLEVGTEKVNVTFPSGTGNAENLPPYQTVYMWKRIS